MTTLTPMLTQYQEIKVQHPDSLLFFRLGDFYELFFEDAVIASKALGIALTKRGKAQGDDIPMCGVPFHAYENYMTRLIKAGHKVAVCEQLETPLDAKKRGPKSIVRRDVVRVVTPGTLTEASLLEARAHNFLLTVVADEQAFGLSVIDISTGDFFCQTVSLDTLSEELARFDPVEILLPQKLSENPKVYPLFQDFKRVLSLQPDSRFDFNNGYQRLATYYNVSTLASLGDFDKAEIVAAGAILDYIYLTQCDALPKVKVLKSITHTDMLRIDPATRRNLELVSTFSGSYHGSFLQTINLAVTSGGRRLVHQRLSAPLRDVFHINERLDEVSWFVGARHQPVRDMLATVSDIERILSRVASGRSGPRDLSNLGCVLETTLTINLWFAAQDDVCVVENIMSGLDAHDLLLNLLQRALKEELPLLARDGNFMALGYDQQLDEWCALRDEGRQEIANLQRRYVEDTGITTLKIKHNNVLGYFVEITALHKDRLCPEMFIHRQTLANNMRYTTQNLSTLAQKLGQAGDQAHARELELFAYLCSDVVASLDSLRQLGVSLSQLDVASSFSALADAEGYVRPLITDGVDFDIDAGRHPIVERSLKVAQKDFMSNNCNLDRQKLWVLTGPNMAGKSTYLRQNALLVILAQMGSFVPAKRATIGVVDRVFSRVGAADDLAKGRSTFMVEMIETATILHQATQRSFVILDEIGRGTSTYDGMAIAWAVVENLYNTIQCRGIFATHYHELSALKESLPNLGFHTMDIKEWAEGIVFLHKVIAGTADKSYGIHVAALAGVPSAVLARAEDILRGFEQQSKDTKVSINSLPLFETQNMVKKKTSSDLEKKLRALDVDTLTPKTALDFLYDIKEKYGLEN